MYNSLIDIPRITQYKYPDRVSHRFRSNGDFLDKTYTDFIKDIESLTLGFSIAGLKAEDHVAFFVNNRYEWSVTDFALQSLSAISIPRGSDTTPVEAEFIYDHSDSTCVIFENVKLLNEYHNIANKADKIFVVDEGEVPSEFSEKTVFYSTLMKSGLDRSKSDPEAYNEKYRQVKPENIVSIIYTSGTTGNPKGVVLTQFNFVQNVYMTMPRMGVDESIGEVTVTVLPSWHAFERTFEYTGLAGGISFVYSSLRYFSQDIKREKPHLLASVPRLWDSIYTKMNLFLKSQPKLKRAIFNTMVKLNYRYKKYKGYLNGSYISYKKEKPFVKICHYTKNIFNICFLFLIHKLAEKMFEAVRENVGGRLRCAISGGGSLPVAIDQFFSSVGIQVLNAYGMTECAPGISSRLVKRNTLGTVGPIFLNTEMKILDEDGQIVEDGEKGSLYIRGPQVMQGYYKNPEATAEVLSEDGWLSTGDLARKTIFGDIVLVGRSKDTIVLLGGENIDPLVIEDKIQESEMVDHVMLLGQDKKGLTAFIALNEQALTDFANDIKVKISDIFPFGNPKSDAEEYKKLEKKIKDELDSKISKESGFKPFEKITQVILVKNTFKIGHELTQTLKIKRKQIEKTYHSIISKFMDDSK